MATLTRNPNRWPRRLFAAAVVGLTLPGTGRAFYFDYGPGSGVSPPPSLLNVPVASANTVNPHPGGNTPGGSGSPPDDNNPPTDFPTEEPPNHAPEPATGVAGLIGLGVVGLARRWRRQK